MLILLSHPIIEGGWAYLIVEMVLVPEFLVELSHEELILEGNECWGLRILNNIKVCLLQFPQHLLIHPSSIHVHGVNGDFSASSININSYAGL